MGTGEQQLLSIQSLERDLKNAERELGKAVSDKQRAQQIEDQWQTEVTSLKSLIEVRRRRLLPESAKPPEAGPGPVIVGEEINRTNWIEALIVGSGSRGVSPPEVLKQAEAAHLSMHPNYPYVVLKKLVTKGTVAKKGGRYYKAT